MTATTRIEPGGFFTNEDFDFGARCALGATAEGIGDVGLVLATIDSIIDGDAQSWFDSWYGMAQVLSARADAARAEGHLRTAAWTYLAASEWFARALGSLDGLADQSVLGTTFAEHRRCWEASVDESEGRIVRIAVPYEATTLPGYLLRPDATGTPRPTLVMTNGSDGSLPGLVGFGAAEALSRGWNVFMYDGPGQQSMLFDRGVPFRPDWEAVLTPVLDALIARPDVDATALTGYGVSQAGYWLTRALAFEHRLVAAVVDPGVVDVSSSWMANLPAEMVELLDSGQRDSFNEIMEHVAAEPVMAATMAFRSRPYNQPDAFSTFLETRRYQVRDVAGQITTPLLITDPEDEQFWPGQSTELHGLLPETSELVHYGRADGANLHCQPLGRRLTETHMVNWLEDQLRSRPQ